MYILDNDGEEMTVTEAQLRTMAKNNGIIDTEPEVCDIEDLIETITECFPDVEIRAV